MRGIAAWRGGDGLRLGRGRIGAAEAGLANEVVRGWSGVGSPHRRMEGRGMEAKWHDAE